MNFERQYTFWRDVSYLDRPVDLLVSPETQLSFQNLMKENKFNYTIYIKNIEESLSNEKKNRKGRSARFGWLQYQKLDKIYDWLDSLAKKYSNIVSIINLSSTFEKRKIKGVKINTDNKTKPIVYLEGGIHAREWISPATVTFLINALVSNKTFALANKYEWYIFPVVNPDGYAYSHEPDRGSNKKVYNQLFI